MTTFQTFYTIASSIISAINKENNYKCSLMSSAYYNYTNLSTMTSANLMVDESIPIMLFTDPHLVTDSEFRNFHTNYDFNNLGIM